MARIIYVLAACLFMLFPQDSLAAPPVQTDPPVEIRVSFPNRAHHEAEVEITFRKIDTQVLQVRMSRSSPGRYRLHDFARNVYAFRALDGQGRELKWSRPDPNGWAVGAHDGTVTVRYTVFGDLISGTYSSIDITHAKLNPPSVFAWARGLEDRPIELEIVPAEPSWKVATQLETTADPTRYRAPSLQYLFDSPIEVSDFSLHEWKVGPETEPATFRMAFHHLGTQAEEREYVDITRRIVDEAAAVFGELPKFDYGSYTFMADYLPWGHGDAMEHRNSTPLSDSRSLAEAAEDHLETLVHEFFHAWNVERLRPRSLEPFDFSRINMSAELWFAEGFTNYYDGLLLARAGAWSKERFLHDLGRTIDRIVRSPALGFGTPRDMSQHAAFRDRGSWRDPQNSHNTYLHYYNYGDAIGVALDLTLRSEKNTSLDALMKALWQSHGRTETPYTETDLENALAKLTDPAFAHDFFERFIRGRELPDYAALLERFALSLTPARPGEGWLGEAELELDEGGLTLGSGTTIGTPFYEAGLDRGDRILAIDGQPIQSLAGWHGTLRSLAPGQKAELHVETRRGRERIEIAAIADPSLTLGSSPAGRTPQSEERRRQREWLASRAGSTNN